MKSKLKQLLPRKWGYLLRKNKLRWQGLLHRGSAYYCPICNHSFRLFFDGGFDNEVNRTMQVIGAGRRASVICPGCQSTDRERLLYIFLIKNDHFIPKEAKILHIAPEPSLSAGLHKKYGKNYISGMKYHEGFYYAHQVELFDLLALPFPDRQFDLVICNHVLEHIVNESLALSEIKRVLVQGGKAILQVPWSDVLEKTYENEDITSENERIAHFGQFDHVRLYGRDYAEHLTKAGFVVEQLTTTDIGIDEQFAKKISINKNEVIFIAHHTI